MRSVRTITAAEMREINRTAILETIRMESPIARSEIAVRLQVSIPTVMRIVDELMEEGLVRATGEKEWSGGRKRPLLEFNGRENLVLAVDMGGTSFYGAVANFGGDILHEIHAPYRPERSDEENFMVLVDLLRQLEHYAAGIGLRLRGAGVGVPGMVDPETGLVIAAPSPKWTNFPLGERLKGHLDVPIIIDNDVNLGALGELWYGGNDGVDHLALISVGTGIGAGIVINGAVFPGFHHMAGEIGYLITSSAHFGKRYDAFGALEQVTSSTGMVEHARQRLAGQRPAAALENLTAEAIFHAAAAGELWALDIASGVCDRLAQAVSAVQLCVDPQVILLGGEIAASGPYVIAEILQRLDGTLPTLPRLQASNLGYRATALGAITKLMQVTTDYYVLQKYS